MTASSYPVTEGAHYLGAIRLRLEQLYEEHPNNPALREQLSDEVGWVDAELEKLSQQNRPEKKTITRIINNLEASQNNDQNQWQDALDAWAKENLPAESAGCITSWSDRVAEFICARIPGVAQARSTSEEMVPKEFNDANIRVARRFMAERDHWYGLVPRADRIQFPFIDPAEPASVSSTLRQCPICARRVASPCETLAIATSCPLSSTNHSGGA